MEHQGEPRPAHERMDEVINQNSAERAEMREESAKRLEENAASVKEGLDELTKRRLEGSGPVFGIQEQFEPETEN